MHGSRSWGANIRTISESPQAANRKCWERYTAFTSHFASGWDLKETPLLSDT